MLAQLRYDQKKACMPANGVLYATDGGSVLMGVCASGVLFDRDMVAIRVGREGVRTIAFPTTVRRVFPGAFHRLRALRAAFLNEGLETLGAPEEICGKPRGSVFARSALESIRLPSTLRVLEDRTFKSCKRLRRVWFAEGLEEIRSRAFCESGIESAELPGSLRTVAQWAFDWCRRLRSVRFGEGLETLGADGPPLEGYQWYVGAFESSALEDVQLPRTLRRIGPCVFRNCKGLRHVALPEGLERIGACCFAQSGLEEVVFPASLRVVGAEAFKDCKQLRSAALNEGLTVLGESWHDGKDELVGGTFSGAALERVRVPSTLRVVERETFLGCLKMRQLELSEGVAEIEDRAFSVCGFESVLLPASMRAVDKNAFHVCPWLQDI